MLAASAVQRAAGMIGSAQALTGEFLTVAKRRASSAVVSAEGALSPGQYEQLRGQLRSTFTGPRHAAPPNDFGSKSQISKHLGCFEDAELRSWGQCRGALSRLWRSAAAGSRTIATTPLPIAESEPLVRLRYWHPGSARLTRSKALVIHFRRGAQSRTHPRHGRSDAYAARAPAGDKLAIESGVLDPDEIQDQEGPAPRGGDSSTGGNGSNNGHSTPAAGQMRSPYGCARHRGSHGLRRASPRLAEGSGVPSGLPLEARVR